MLSQIGPQLWFLQNKIPQKALDSDLGACYVLPSRCECPDIERIRKAQGIELCVATHQTTQVLRFRPWRNSCFSSMATQTNLQVGINRWSWLGYKSGHVFFFFFRMFGWIVFFKINPRFLSPLKKKGKCRLGGHFFGPHIFFFSTNLRSKQKIQQNQDLTVDGWNPADQLRLVVYPIIYRVLYTSQVVVWDFWTINSRWLSLLCFNCFNLST